MQGRLFVILPGVQCASPRRRETPDVSAEREIVKINADEEVLALEVHRLDGQGVDPVV